jgi:hypothetical protein
VAKITVDFRFDNSGKPGSGHNDDDYVGYIDYFDELDTHNQFSTAHSAGSRIEIDCPDEVEGVLAVSRLKWSAMFGDMPFEYIYNGRLAYFKDMPVTTVRNKIFKPIQDSIFDVLAGGFDAEFYTGLLNQHNLKFIDQYRHAQMSAYDNVFAVARCAAENTVIDMRLCVNMYVHYGAGGAIVDERYFRRHGRPMTLAFKFREIA